MCSGNLLYFSMSLQMLIACMDVAVALFEVWKNKKWIMFFSLSSDSTKVWTQETISILAFSSST